MAILDLNLRRTGANSPAQITFFGPSSLEVLVEASPRPSCMTPFW
jgi:hypothetical protein